MTQIQNTIITVASGLYFPEGPAFDNEGNLWLVELKGGNLVRVKEEGALKRYPTNGSPNGIAFDKRGRLWFCDAGQNSIRVFDPQLETFETIVSAFGGTPINKPNDLAFDSSGNLVFTCPGDSRKDPHGYACCLTTDNKLKLITSGKYFPNGLAFSPDGGSLIMAETYRHRLWKGKWNAVQASWTNESVWCDIGGPQGPGGPDGMAFDDEGNLYVAVFGTGLIKVVNPEGKISDEISLPGTKPTNCAFDPTRKSGLIVTEADLGILISLEVAARAGKVFKG